MAVEGTTKNYGWVKPVIQGSPATWGGFLNTDLDSIDALVFSNQQGVVPIGSGALWFAGTPPANWLICDGSSLDTSTYASLFAVIGYTWGGSGANFNLPNPFSRALIGAGSGLPLNSQGGEASHTLTVAEMPVHPHPIVDVAHNHGINQSVHGHGDPGHTHGVNDPGHAHGTNAVGTASGVNYAAGAGFTPVGATINAAGSNISIQAAGTGIQPANANISLNASGTGLSTTQNAGGGAAHNNWPPYLAINMIIRYQ